MPKSYTPEAKRQALSLYIALGDMERVAEEMRLRHGYPKLNVETLRRWKAEGDWDKVRAQQAGDEARAALALDAQALTSTMLASYQDLRTTLQEKLKANQVEFTEGVGLLVKIDGLIRALVAQQKNRVQPVDKAALALEVLQFLLERLAEHDPLILELVQPHISALGEALKQRYAEAA